MRSTGYTGKDGQGATELDARNFVKRVTGACCKVEWQAYLGANNIWTTLKRILYGRLWSEGQKKKKNVRVLISGSIALMTDFSVCLTGTRKLNGNF